MAIQTEAAGTATQSLSDGELLNNTATTALFGEEDVQRIFLLSPNWRELTVDERGLPIMLTDGKSIVFPDGKIENPDNPDHPFYVSSSNVIFHIAFTDPKREGDATKIFTTRLQALAGIHFKRGGYTANDLRAVIMSKPGNTIPPIGAAMYKDGIEVSVMQTGESNSRDHNALINGYRRHRIN